MKIEWSEFSNQNLENIRDYIAKDSPYFANRFIRRIIAETEYIEQFPKIGRKVPELETELVREIIFQNYRIIYQIKEKELLILTVVHGSRDLTKLDFIS